MSHRSNIVATTALLSVLLLGGCQTSSSPDRDSIASPASELHSLTLIATELQMHLRSDTYRSARPADSSGRDVFAVALWRLDRLQAERGVEPGEWTNADLVIEFARARSLERLRRYSEAAAAYQRVSDQGSLLQERAVQALAVMQTFAAETGSPEAIVYDDATLELDALEARILRWREIVAEHLGSPYESLAREELETWLMERVELLAQVAGSEAALAACHELIEENRASKFYARHLIRIGDLYSEAARLELSRSRVTRARFDASRYDALLDRAFAAYELAGEQRRPSERVEAGKKIEALLAAHRGVLTHVR